MKKTLSILLIMLLLTACGAKDGVSPSQPDSDPAPQASRALPELETTDWEALSTDAAAFGLGGGLDNPNFEYIFNHTDTVPLDQLAAFTLTADGGFSEGAMDEIYHRFLEAPHKVMAYLILLDGQITELPGWEPMPTAEIVCQFIATTDAVMYDGTEEFAQILQACREAYPEGPAAELLDILEREHAEALERFRAES